MQPIHIQLSLKTKHFFSSFFCILELYIDFGTYSKKKMTLIANVFLKLRTSKNYRFRASLDKQHGKRAQTLLKSEQQHVYHIYLSVGRQSSLKKSFLVICTIWRLFANTSTSYDKTFFLNRENLMQPIHMQLSITTKEFFWIFFCIFKI